LDRHSTLRADQIERSCRQPIPEKGDIAGFAGELACAGGGKEQLRVVADGLRFTIIEGCGHLVLEEKPKELVAIVASFLEFNQPSTGPPRHELSRCACLKI
jgi:hypothetical protein